jgi:membrane-associated phospholipid phosphatase
VGLRSSEWVCAGYFAYLILVCSLRSLAWRRRAVIVCTSIALLAAIGIVASRAPLLARDWAPLAYIGVAYYLTGWLFVEPSVALEAWLLRWDHRLFGDPTTRFAEWPRWFTAYLDIVYTCCFLLLPAGLLALRLGGHAAGTNRYWTMVAVADLGAFAPLSVFQTRPPWQIERDATLSAARVHAVASRMVRRATTGANTFPSGHVAVSLAVSIAVIASMPVAGAILLALTATIAVGCVVGRYHYAVDAAAGAAWGLLACLLTYQNS